MLLKAEEKVEAGQAPFEEVRNEIEPTLRQKYADEKYQKWMAELRKRSRVREYE
jgi:parvulin-like peptidyl-prolyl isomerase